MLLTCKVLPAFGIYTQNVFSLWPPNKLLHKQGDHKVQHKFVCGTFDAIVEETAFLGYSKNTGLVYERSWDPTVKLLPLVSRTSCSRKATLHSFSGSNKKVKHPLFA
jgi:hypothetical protein